MRGWSFDIPELTSAQREFLLVLRAAVNGHVPAEPPADWAAVLDLASAHQVADFLYPCVQAWPQSCQPSAALMARWKALFLNAAGLYTCVAVQANELLAALHAAGVRVIPLKGVWLAERVYEDGACRPMCDIDLLVPAEELARARSAVGRLGYTTTDYYHREECNKHTHYRKPGAPLTLELHWRLWMPDAEAAAEPDLASIWTGLHEERLHGVPVLVFSPERQLVYLTQHILQHFLTVPLKTYLDLILMCRRYAPHFDPSRLDEEARAGRGTFGTKFILQLAGDIWAVRPPAFLAAFVTACGACEEERRAALCAAVQLDKESNRITPSVAEFYQASWIRRIRIGLSCLAWPPGEIRELYPRAVRRFGLAGGYAARCADLVRRHGRALRRKPGDGKGVDATLANFAIRQALATWIQAQDAREAN